MYESFFTLNQDALIYEIEGMTSEIFYKYLVEFSKYKHTNLKLLLLIMQVFIQ